MIDNLLRDLQVLRKADFLIARIWLNALARRLSFFAFAALIAVFALGMANMAGYYALQGAVGPVWAAVIVAAVDLAIAAIVLLAGANSRPGPEIDLAFDVRKMAWDSIEADTKDLKRAVDNLGQNIHEARATVAGFVQNPLDIAAQKLLVPAALSLLRGLRAKKEHA
jgi:hypothetical protein